MENKPEIKNQIDLLLKDCKEHKFKDSDIEIVKQVAFFAAKKHDGQFRKSGEPYIIHPIATARILVSWNMDIKTIITGLLHDVLEDTQTSDDEITELFGADICQLVNYVTKVNLFSKENRGMNKKTNENEYLIQVLLSMSHDIRAMIVKLADRFHNMSTISFLPRHKQIQIADETLNIYAKVAGRLGMYRLKTNLLDMSFEILNKEAYDQTKQIINNIENSYNGIWEEVTNKIIGILDSYSMQYTLKKRIKGIYSTYEKLEKGYRINDIHDIYAIRIITNNNLDCYTTLGLIHMNFIFISNAFKDYISMPKFNYYQSLHTTIIKDQALIEIQIRTQAMDLLAENGIAAHWNYKETNDYKSDLPTKFLVEEINNLQEKTESNIRGITNDNIFSVIIVNDEKPYTVNNKTRCIDLAYRYNNHSFKFLKKVIVNGKPVSFDNLLKPQDVVKFNYSDKIEINRKWLKFTNFHVTIEGIKEILKNEFNSKIVTENDFFKKAQEILKENYIGDEEATKKIKKKVSVETIQEFLDNVTPQLFENEEFYKLFDKRKQIRRKAFNSLLENNLLSVKIKKEFYFNKIDGLYFSDLKFPKCCNKVPGASAVGIIDKNGILQVHNYNCSTLKKQTKAKLLPLTWNENALLEKPRKFRYELEFSTIWMPSVGNIIATKLKKYDNLINELIVEKNKNSPICKIKVIVYTSHINSIKAAFAELNQEINIKTNLTF